MYIVRSTEVFDSCGAGIRVIGTCDVVGDKVHQYPQTCSVCPLDEGIKLTLSLVGIFRQVGIDVVVIFDGIGRTSRSLHRVGVVGTNAVVAVVGLGRVLQETDVPDVGCPKAADIGESFGAEVPHLP